MKGKPIAVNSGLTVRHDLKPGSGEDSLVFSGSGLSGPLYLGTSSLHTIFQHMGREAVLRLLGEPELPVGRPPAPGTKGWADKMRAMEPLSTHVWGMADQQFVHKRHIKALERGFRQLEDTVVHNPDSVLHRLQKTEGLLGQALGRIENLERLFDSLFTKDILSRLSALEAQGEAGVPPGCPSCGADICECFQAGHEATRTGE